MSRFSDVAASADAASAIGQLDSRVSPHLLDTTTEGNDDKWKWVSVPEIISDIMVAIEIARDQTILV